MAIDAVNVGTVAILSISDTAVEAKGGAQIREILARPVDTEGKSCEEGSGNANCKPFYQVMNEALCGNQGNTNSGDCLIRIKEPDSSLNLLVVPREIYLAFGVYLQI